MDFHTNNKKWSVIFYFSLIGIILFEFLKVYFIMPFPGSQTMDSVDFAYFLHTKRWFLRVFFGASILISSCYILQKSRKWLPLIFLFIAFFICYVFNFRMSADAMFLQPKNVVFKTKLENKIPNDRLIMGIINNGEAKGYPIQFLAYHHQIRDTIGDTPALITYCNVCRTGRVFKPLINKKHEKFRLVGMDHFNAMLEDESTGSWWRQTTGEAITGKMKGFVLPEMYFKQITVEKWLRLYPHAKIMQADPTFLLKYDSMALFEKGKSKGNLTRTDTFSWNPKSWIIGIIKDTHSKVYDWKYLTQVSIINDTFQNTRIFIALASDKQSFVAFENPLPYNFNIYNDTFYCDNEKYSFLGHNIKTPDKKLKPITAYQEFWHSWKNFHPHTIKYETSEKK